MLELILFSTLVAIVGIVAVDVLMEPGMILGWWLNLVDRLPERMTWLRKPLGECIFCFVGQLMLWAYLIHYWEAYNPAWHAISVAWAIFVTKLYISLLYGTQKN